MYQGIRFNHYYVSLLMAYVILRMMAGNAHTDEAQANIERVLVRVWGWLSLDARNWFIWRYYERHQSCDQIMAELKLMNRACKGD